MKNKTISVLAAAVLSIGIGFAATSGATAAPLDAMQASVNTSADLRVTVGGSALQSTNTTKRNALSKGKPRKIRLNAKVCYERKRLGPRNFVIVRRAC